MRGAPFAYIQMHRNFKVAMSSLENLFVLHRVLARDTEHRNTNLLVYWFWSVK